ncbi:hypothetical protein BH09GEM1_BH09GEM1_25230 [soil metagenome]
MKSWSGLAVASLMGVLAGARPVAGQAAPAPPRWKSNEMNRPRPAELTPPAQALPLAAPSDAIVLFDGRDLSKWELVRGGPADWKVENGYMEVVNGPGVIDPKLPGTGAIRTKEAFGDMQLHVEWASPNPPKGVAQDRGNSGVYLMGRYEVQVLDSYQQADTYADGQAGAIYGQYPPLANPTRPPGEWQAYDILFRAPRYAPDGTLTDAPRVTVILNGIVVQNNELIRERARISPAAAALPMQGPIQLQEHHHPVRYRNVWVRRIPERPEPGPDYAP